MNYHIIPQDKFFNSYIEDLFKINCEDNNLVFVKGYPGDNNSFSTSRKIRYLGYRQEQYHELLSRLNDGDNLYISWYDTFIGRIVINSGIKNKIFVYLMGGEFYSEPFWKHSKWLLDKRTCSLAKKIYLPRIHIDNTPKQNFHAIKHLFQIHSTQNQQYSEKLMAVSRIDYLIIPPHDELEICKLQKLYPTLKARPIYGLFNQNYDIAKRRYTPTIANHDKCFNILIGNSSDICNNHIDAFQLISHRMQGNYSIFCPLAYGDETCKQAVIKYGHKYFGNRFFPITDFLSANEYVDFINKMDVVIMNHNRQQALGNIIIALTLGKVVYLKESNPIYSMMVKMNIPVYDINKFNQNNIIKDIESTQTEHNNTISAIEANFSENVRLSLLKDILCHI